MQMRRRTIVELKAAIYEREGWTRAAGESQARRIKLLYDVSLDHGLGMYVATRKPTTQEQSE